MEYGDRFDAPQEVVEDYNAAVIRRDEAIKLARDHSMKADVRKFLMSIVGRGYGNYHNEAMAAVPNAQRRAERYAEDYLPALEDMAAAEARVAGKEISLPFERE